MQPAVIFSIPMTTSPSYCWRWRSVDGKTDSRTQFVYYRDCLADANANGHSVQLMETHGDTVPSHGALKPRENAA